MSRSEPATTRSLNDRLAAGGLELSGEDIKVLADEANRWLRADKLSRPKLRAYLGLFVAPTTRTLQWLESKRPEVLQAYTLHTMEIPRDERAILKEEYTRIVGGPPSYPWLRGIIAAYLAVSERVDLPLPRK